MTDQNYMLQAIQLAKQGEGWTNPNPMVGAAVSYTHLSGSMISLKSTKSGRPPTL